MHYYEVAPSRIARAGSGVFTYESAEKFAVGQLVLVPLGKNPSPGVVVREVKRPQFATKPVASVLEAAPLPGPLVELALWLSEYYATPLATTLQVVLPRGLQKKRREVATKGQKPPARQRTNFLFNTQQQAAIKQIDAAKKGTVLLHGITGSGKTAVYIDAVTKALASGRSAIVLVPEIALTSQIVDEFSHHFSDIILTHSRQTEAERHRAWREALTSKAPRLVIGPRSALFMPLRSVGAIIIDEAHEPSFKQEQSPRYSALRAASVLGQLHGAKVILGSATPPVTDYYLASSAGKPIITMDTPARTDTVKPAVTLVDMTRRALFKKHRFLSDTLLEHIEQTLQSGNQSLIFHNRRGSASSTLCENCGWIAGCPRCFVPLTLHADKHHLRCHICGYTGKVPTSCPECAHTDILHKGIGTKLIESELAKLFPRAVVARFDGDSRQTETVESRYADIYDGKIDILIGTQVIAKGLDLPHLRTVGVVQADAGLSLPDYSSSERTFQLLAQVVGRVGRSRHPTSVIIQSYQPTHPSVVAGVAQDYDSFYRFALAERRRGLFPPYRYLLKLTCVYKTETAAVKNAQKLAERLRMSAGGNIELLGPTPAFYERQHDTYRWQLVVKSPRRADLVALLELLPPAHWQYELDPTSLL